MGMRGTQASGWWKGRWRPPNLDLKVYLLFFPSVVCRGKLNLPINPQSVSVSLFSYELHIKYNQICIGCNSDIIIFNLPWCSQANFIPCRNCIEFLDTKEDPKLIALDILFTEVFTSILCSPRPYDFPYHPYFISRKDSKTNFWARAWG